MQAHTFNEQTSADSRGGEDLRSYLAPVWRRRWLVLALVVAVTAGTYLFYNSKPHIYATATDVLVGSDNDELVLGSPVYTTSRALANQVRLAQTTAVAEQVGKDLGFRGDPRVLLGAVSVQASERRGHPGLLLFRRLAADGGRDRERLCQGLHRGAGEGTPRRRPEGASKG